MGVATWTSLVNLGRAQSGGDQQGQTLVFFALVAGLLLFALMSLVGDYAITLSHYNKIDEAAVLGAQAGAAQIDAAAFMSSGVVRLKQPDAWQECERIVRQDAGLSPQGTVTCTAGHDGVGDLVTADVHDSGQLVVRLLGSTFQIHATHYSRPAYGTTVPCNVQCQ